MNATVVVDASLVVALLIPERYTYPAMRLWEGWIDEDKRITAPALLGYEVTSAVYRKALQGKISLEDGQSALQHFIAMGIECLYLPELHLDAMRLARQFNRPNPYDTHYMALAETLDCPVWTADERLYNTVREKFLFIHWVEEPSDQEK